MALFSLWSIRMQLSDYVVTVLTAHRSSNKLELCKAKYVYGYLFNLGSSNIMSTHPLMGII